MTVPMICETFSVDQKNELYTIIGRILNGGTVHVNLDFLSNDNQKEAAKLIIDTAIKDMPGVKVDVFYVHDEVSNGK